MAVKILNSVHEKTIGKTNYVRADISVDSAAELPTEINGNVLTMCSLAWDISTGDFYGLDSKGVWHIQTGEDTAQSNLSTLQGSTRFNSPKGIKYQDDIKTDNIEDSEQSEGIKEGETDAIQNSESR